MRYAVLAAGFDGTLVRSGRCDERSIRALHALAAAGRKLILATSRELREVLDVFPEAQLFDYLVAENGAVVHCPAVRESAILAHAPSETLIHELRRRGVEPLRVGSVAVTTRSEHRATLEDAIARLRLDSHLLDNGEKISLLPTGVNKATGVAYALDGLGLSHHNLVAIGAAESDLALFDLAEHSAALANASVRLKQAADRVTRAAYADGVHELAMELLANDLQGAPTRRNIALGLRSGQAHRVALPPGRRSLLVTGPPASGKAFVCRRMLDQYLTQHYQCCVIGGARTAALFSERDAIATCGDAFDAPNPGDVTAVFEHPTRSVFVNLASLRGPARSHFIGELFERIEVMSARRGRPHVIVLDCADGAVEDAAIARLRRLNSAMRVLVIECSEQLPQDAVNAIDVVIALGDSAARTIASLGGTTPALDARIEAGQALTWFKDSGTAPFRLDLEGYMHERESFEPESQDSAHASLRIARDASVIT